MNAVDEIQQAITALTNLRDHCSPAPWSVTHDEGIAINCNIDPGNSTSSPRVADLMDENGDTFNPDPGGADTDAYLIVTLHRTIDAQLTILEAARSARAKGFGNDKFFANDLALARAINGTST